mgnify:CR=1 FL=1
MKTTLVIMAAGIGSRFGGGIKQLAPVGLNGEIIMDYTLLLEIPFKTNGIIKHETVPGSFVSVPLKQYWRSPLPDFQNG